MPVSAAQALFNTESLFRLLIQVRGREEMARVRDEVIETIRLRHQGERDVTVITQDALLATFDRIFTALTLTLAGIASISLAVAGVLIMNVMLVSVSQRTAEVGLLKAIGARQSQITALFLKKRLLGIRGSLSPFVFIWDTDVAEIMQRAVTGEVTGAFNVAGDGALPITEIAERLGKRVLWLPDRLLQAALAVGSRLGVSRYGPEQTRFLKHRPVLDNSRLKEVFGYTPRLTSAEAFEAWLASHPDAHA